MPNRTATKSQRGFTLIELLIVIAVVGILASMLLQLGTMIRDQSQQADCGTNLRNSGMSLLTYAVDNRGLLPPGHQYGPMANVADGRWSKMSQYYDGDSPFVCPMYRSLIRSGAIIPPDKSETRGGGMGDQRAFTYYYFIGDTSSDHMAVNNWGVTIRPRRVPQILNEIKVPTLIMADQNCSGLSNIAWQLDFYRHELPAGTNFIANHGRGLSKLCYGTNQKTDWTPNHASAAVRCSPTLDRTSGGNSLLSDGTVIWKKTTFLMTNPTPFIAPGFYSGEEVFAYDESW